MKISAALVQNTWCSPVLDLRHFNKDIEYLSFVYIQLYLMTWEVEYISMYIFAILMMRWLFVQLFFKNQVVFLLCFKNFFVYFGK